MARSDPLSYAAYWALRAQANRIAGKHEHPDHELARIFGGEWGLVASEQGTLFRTLLAQVLQRAKEEQ